MPFVILKKVLSWDGTGRVRGKFVYRRVEHAHPFLLFAVGSYNSSLPLSRGGGVRCVVCLLSLAETKMSRSAVPPEMVQFIAKLLHPANPSPLQVRLELTGIAVLLGMFFVVVRACVRGC
jgi:hypothetical protein